MSIDLSTLVLPVIAGLIALMLLVAAVRIVPEYQRLVVLRLGRVVGAKGPGLVLLIPFIDRGRRVDLREQFFDVPPQTTITKDNANLMIDFLVYSKIVDALPSVLNVEDHIGAARGIAITTLRAVVGGMLLDEVLSNREVINEALRGKLDEVTNRWGIKVTAVEIREITPSREIHEAMSRQMSAERTRRAMVIEADGQRDAAIRVADGRKQASILEAEGGRQAEILRAEGYALALSKISEAARDLDSKTMTLQYLEALEKLGSSAATKLLIPLELTTFLRPILENAARVSDGDRRSGRAAAPAMSSPA